MTPDQLERAIAGIRSVHSTVGHEGVAALAIAAGLASLDGSEGFDGITFDFNQLCGLERIQIPPQSLDSAMPNGWTVDSLDPYFARIKEAIEAGKTFATVEPPAGLSSQELFDAWSKLLLFIDSGAVLRQSSEHNKRTARLRIEERGLSEILVVLDESYRVISGLPYLWALSEMDGFDSVPAVILHGAPSDAGWEHTHAEALRWGETLWKKGEIQEALDSSTPAEREFFQAFGFHQVPEITVLTLSWETFDRLGPLVEKQLGGTTKLDPAQLLFVESLREAILDARQRIIAEWKGDQDDKDKLKLHLREERDMVKGGQKIAAQNGWKWLADENDLWHHPALPKYRFKIVDSQPTAETPPDRQAQPDSHIMSLPQFRLLARDHFGVDADEASRLYESESADSFNARLRAYVQAVEPIDRRGSNGPSDEERARQTERLALWNHR